MEHQCRANQPLSRNGHTVLREGDSQRKRTIERSVEPIESVAKAVGFVDPERMRRAFLRLYGYPPQAVRRRRLKAISTRCRNALHVEAWQRNRQETGIAAYLYRLSSVNFVSALASERLSRQNVFSSDVRPNLSICAASTSSDCDKGQLPPSNLSPHAGRRERSIAQPRR